MYQGILRKPFVAWSFLTFSRLLVFSQKFYILYSANSVLPQFTFDLLKLPSVFALLTFLALLFNMKILPSYSSIYFFFVNKSFLLIFAMQLLIFGFLSTTVEVFVGLVVLYQALSLYEIWWAQMWFLANWLLRNQNGLLICALSLARFGGLKWTRTIDLTLIRRVL